MPPPSPSPSSQSGSGEYSRHPPPDASADGGSSDSSPSSASAETRPAHAKGAKPSAAKPAGGGGSNVFPMTMNTWIGRNLAEGGTGRLNVNNHVMSVYAFPLRVYFLGTRDRWLGEPDDVVQGFFADRLHKPDFFADWQAAAMRLRHWLINAFCFYLKELRRAKQRDSKMVGAPSDIDEPVTFEGDPVKAVDQAFVVSIVREALKRAGDLCEKEGLGQHWQVFMEHFYRQRSYEQVCPELGITPTRAVVMARTASKKFQAALQEILAGDRAGATGTPEDAARLNEEIMHLIKGAGT